MKYKRFSTHWYHHKFYRSALRYEVGTFLKNGSILCENALFESEKFKNLKI